MSLFAELKRRNVFRAGVTYAVLGGVLLQTADIVLPAFSAPAWVLRVLLFFLILGFPLVLLVSWVYELTPDGLKRTSEVDTTNSIRHETGARLNYITIGSVVVLLLVTLFNRSPPEATVAPQAEPGIDAASAAPAAQEASTTTIMNKSIAVLPLDDFNAGGDEEYFADGLTEEILNALTRTPDLLVASRTSSFQYKDQAVDIQQVAQALGVAHVLEGSVRRSAERLRVTVQLIRASDGFHLWSENYDRAPEDIIAVQEDIAFQIATALQTAMDPVALQQMVQAGTRSVEAYNAYLKGLAYQANFSADNQRIAYDLFEQARAIDPGFAAAHYCAAMYWWSALNPTLIVRNAEVVGVSDMTKANFLERIGQAIANAKASDRYYFQALEAQVNLQYNQTRQLLRRYWDEAPPDLGTGIALTEASAVRLAVWTQDRELTLQMLEQLRALPTLSGRMMGELAFVAWTVGDLEKGIEMAREFIARHPDDEFLRYQTHRALLVAGYVDEARALAQTITGLQVPAENVAIVRMRQACADGNTDEATRIFEESLSQGQEATVWIALNELGRVEESRRYLQAYAQESNLYTLSTFAQYPFFDLSQFPSLQAVLQQEGIALHDYQPLPYMCKAQAQ